MNLTDKLLINLKKMKRAPLIIKSLDGVTGFTDGFLFRDSLYEWEKNTGLSLSENLDIAIDSVMEVTNDDRIKRIMDNIPLNTSIEETEQLVYKALDYDDIRIPSESSTDFTRKTKDISEEIIAHRKRRAFDEFVKSHYEISRESGEDNIGFFNSMGAIEVLRYSSYFLNRSDNESYEKFLELFEAFTKEYEESRDS